MKKIGLICATLLAGISLTACSNTASQKSNKKSSSSSVTTTKAVKHHNVHKESKKDSQSSSSSAVSSQSNSQASQTSTQQSGQNGSQQQAVQSAQQSNSQQAGQQNSPNKNSISSVQKGFTDHSLDGAGLTIKLYDHYDPKTGEGRSGSVAVDYGPGEEQQANSFADQQDANGQYGDYTIR